jgi:hypothetical protein
MRNRFFVYFLFILFNLISQTIFSQNYIPFPKNNGYWNEREFYSSSGSGIIETIHTIYFDGDSTLNGFDYSKLYSSGVVNEYNSFGSLGSSTSFNHILYALIREDSSKHIFSYSDGSDYLIYDFNLSLNDTLDPHAYRYILAEGTYVSSIDSVLIGITIHKRYHLSVPNLAVDYISLTEGVGSSFGLLNFMGYALEQSKKLNCFRNNEGDYILDSANCKYVDVGQVNYDEFILVYPNPVSDIINVKLENLRAKKIILSDIFGNEIFCFNKLEDDIQIDISYLIPGMYFITFETEFGTIFKKFVKE